jgi:hypothetical protein
MTQTRTAAAAALALVVCAGTASAQDPDNRPGPERYGLRLEYRWFTPDFTGDVRKGNEIENLVDFVDDLGFVDNSTFDARMAIQFKRGLKLRGSYTPLDYLGDHDAPETFTYGDTRYERDTRVRSSVKGALYTADIEWDFVKAPWGYLGVLFGAKAIDVDTSVVDVADNVREVDTFRVGNPVLGITGRAYSKKFSVDGEFSGLSVGDHGHMYDAATGMRFHVSDKLALMGGYRWIKVTGKDEPDELHFRLSGWQFGLELSL